MNKEEVYDEQISPLIQQIIEICKESRIAMVFSASISHPDDEGLMCTTQLLEDDMYPPQCLISASAAIRGRSSSTTMVTTTDGDTGNTTMTAFI